MSDEDNPAGPSTVTKALPTPERSALWQAIEKFSKAIKSGEKPLANKRELSLASLDEVKERLTVELERRPKAEADLAAWLGMADIPEDEKSSICSFMADRASVLYHESLHFVGPLFVSKADRDIDPTVIDTHGEASRKERSEKLREARNWQAGVVQVMTPSSRRDLLRWLDPDWWDKVPSMVEDAKTGRKSRAGSNKGTKRKREATEAKAKVYQATIDKLAQRYPDIAEVSFWDLCRFAESEHGKGKQRTISRRTKDPRIKTTDKP